MADRPLVLHLGCATAELPFFLKHCDEVRLDIDPEVKPDVLANMAAIPEDIGPFDAVFSCHSLEHLYPHEADLCIAGCMKVLKPGGALIIFVPDLEGLSPTEDLLYESHGGPVYAADLFYGWRRCLHIQPYMAHKNGFMQATLRGLLEHHGFVDVKVLRMTEPYPYNLAGMAFKPKIV